MSIVQLWRIKVDINLFFHSRNISILVALYCCPISKVFLKYKANEIHLTAALDWSVGGKWPKRSRERQGHRCIKKSLSPLVKKGAFSNCQKPPYISKSVYIIIFYVIIFPSFGREAVTKWMLDSKTTWWLFRCGRHFRTTQKEQNACSVV